MFNLLIYSSYNIPYIAVTFWEYFTRIFHTRNLFCRSISHRADRRCAGSRGDDVPEFQHGEHQFLAPRTQYGRGHPLLRQGATATQGRILLPYLALRQETLRVDLPRLLEGVQTVPFPRPTDFF